MGIFIHLDISKSVTQEEWQKVYEESLFLAKLFNLGECKTIEIHQQDVYCMVKTNEKTEMLGWGEKTPHTGWETCGDYITMRRAEDEYMPKNLVKDEKEVQADAGDAILSELPGHLSYSYDDKLCKQAYHIWGNKTQGEPYHMYLLAIACMIESRLGNKAFISGDITRGQCVKAVEMANQYLTKPVEMPSRCDLERFYKRISMLPLDDLEQFELFDALYLGNKDADYGAFIRKQYSSEVFHRYWKNEFKDINPKDIGLSRPFSHYMLWGFGLEQVFDYIQLKTKKSYTDFIKSIMKSKLHVKEKYTDDVIGIDQDSQAPYSIWTLMAQFAFRGAKNYMVDRYIPIDEIRNMFNRVIGDKCDVNSIIEQCLRDEESEKTITDDDLNNRNIRLEDYSNTAETFNKVLARRIEEEAEYQQRYDISMPEDALFFEKGNTIAPIICSSMKGLYKLYLSLQEEDEYKRFFKEEVNEHFRFLIKCNKYVLLRDCDWNRIYSDISNNPKSFGRYYTMVCTKVSHDNIIYILRAWTLNDQFFEQCRIEYENTIDDE
jgi:hypothetical protein